MGHPPSPVLLYLIALVLKIALPAHPKHSCAEVWLKRKIHSFLKQLSLPLQRTDFHAWRLLLLLTTWNARDFLVQVLPSHWCNDRRICPWYIFPFSVLLKGTEVLSGSEFGIPTSTRDIYLKLRSINLFHLFSFLVRAQRVIYVFPVVFTLASQVGQKTCSELQK